MGLFSLPAIPSGYDTGLFVIHDKEGLTEFLGMTLTGGEVRRMLRDLGREFVSPPVAVPPGVVRFLLSQAADRSRELKRPVPEGYEAFSGLAASVAPIVGPPIYQFLDSREVKERVDLSERGSSLLNHESMLSLMFYDEVIPYLEQLKEAESSVLVLSEEQKQARIQSVLDQAAREILTGERKDFFKHQLEELSFYLWQSGNIDLAETAMAAALEVDREAIPESEYSFAREAVRLTFKAGFQFLEHEADANPDGAEVQDTGSDLIIPG